MCLFSIIRFNIRLGVIHLVRTQNFLEIFFFFFFVQEMGEIGQK